MTVMASLKRVPCVDITIQNLDHLWNDIVSSLNKCHFVAIDLELSGLGPRNKLNEKLIDERYRAVIDTAKTRSILSFGIATFTYDKSDDHTLKTCQSDDHTSKTCQSDDHTSKTCHHQSLSNTKDIVPSSEEINTQDIELAQSSSIINHQLTDETQSKDDENVWNSDTDMNMCNHCKLSSKIYNLMCLCDDEYIVEPDTLRFLVSHGFDFNRQCAYGLSYHKGNDDERDDDRSKASVRNLLCHIISRKIPIVVHNGFIDLLFIYQNFYCDLPNDLQTFLTDLSQMFSSGIYDTKYISDFHIRLSRSYLEYLFYDRQRYNLERILKGSNSISVSFPMINSEIHELDFRDLSTKLYSVSPDDSIVICKDYAYHGWCKMNNSCTKSHNIDHILDEKKKQKSKRIKKEINKLRVINDYLNNDTNNCNESNEQTHSTDTKEGVHSAGYDAFMTGYCFASFIATLSTQKPDPECRLNAKNLGIKQLINNIYLTGKDQPLRVIGSSFVKASLFHKNKYDKIKEFTKIN